MEIESLEVRSKITNLQEQIGALINKIYPVGSYYETSDPNFNPNTEWGGSWLKDSKGLVTVGAYMNGEHWDSSYTNVYIKQGEKIGESEHTLTINEMPSHKHSLTSWRNPTESTPQPTTGYGFTSNNYAFSNVATDGDGTNYTANDSVAIGASGYGDPHNIIQPSIGVYRWHRIS